MEGRQGAEHDVALLARWQEGGDVEALDQLLRLEIGRLRARLDAGDSSASPATHEDVAQEAVLRVLRADPPPCFDTPAAFRGYLWTCARHLLVDRLRTRREPVRIDAHTADGLTRDPATRGSIDRVEREDLATALEVAVNLLPDADRDVLRLVYFEGRTIQDAARRLGLSPGGANMRLVRARVRLAEKVAAWRDVVGDG